MMLVDLKKLIEANPLFQDKLALPTLKASRLRTLINQSLNWQHQQCKNPRPNPDIKTLFVDHSCSPTNEARASTPVTLPVAALAKPTYAPLGAHGGPFLPAAAANANLAGLVSNANPSLSVQSAVVAASPFPVQPSQVSGLKHPTTPSNALGMSDYQSSDHEQLMKRQLPAQSVDEVSYPPPPQHASWSLDDLPRTVACTLHLGFNVISMDFPPSHHTLLAVGCSNGEITLWEVGIREKLVSRPFKVWNMTACSNAFQVAMVKDTSMSVSRVSWNQDGSLIGVAFTKHLVHLYSYQGPTDLRQHLEIDAHSGSVSDLAFSHPNKQLCIITCGEDKLIKVWDLVGRNLYRLEGHEAPVYSI